MILYRLTNMSDRARWYVVHTYSGYENKVKANLEKAIENRNLEALIHDIQVPMEEVVEEKDGKQKSLIKEEISWICACKNVNGR
ncbi:transcription antitermination factor NusG [Clostridium beijerinckii]|nr:transcription antitermination factor NusG [Clostridium beijerinckii]